jgi:cleavage and polyadenylation specificity factor subunit 1
LVPVAFLDANVYATSIKTLKNLVLIGDMVKSVWFCVFQVGCKWNRRRFDTG